MNANEIFYRFSPLVQDFIYANGWETLRPIQVAAAEVIFDSDDNLILCSAKPKRSFFRFSLKSRGAARERSRFCISRR